MSRPIVFMAPGQGVQYAGMGGSLYAGNKGFRGLMDQSLQQFESEWTSRIATIIRHPERVIESDLEDCRITHPLVFTVHYALGALLQAHGIRPTHVLGYSLGELVASVLSGALSLEDGMKIALETGAWVHENTPPAGMMAIFASPEVQADYYPYFEGVATACHNFPDHFVVSGRREELALIADQLTPDGIHCEMLPIRRGFHSPDMDPFQIKAANWAHERPDHWRKGSIPQYSCALGRELTSADLTYHHLGRVHRRPVLFQSTFRKIDQELQPRFIDLSVSGTLAAFARKLVPRARTGDILSLQSRFGDGNTQFERFLQTWSSE